MPGRCPQRRGTARTLPNFFVALCIFCFALCIFCVVLCIFVVVLCDVCFVTFPVLFVCICVLNNCHRVATQLQLNISYHITYSECVFVNLVIQYASACAVLYCYLWPVWINHIFPNYLIKGVIFE
jgi:hypothetical protein